MPDPVPVLGRVGLADVLQFRAAGVTDVEQIAEDPYGVALLSVAQERRDGYVEVLPQQIEQRRLDRGDGVDGGPQIEGLGAAPTGVAIGEAVTDLAQDALVVTDLRSDDQGLGIPQRPRDLLPAGDLTETRTSSESVRTTTLRVK